MKALALSLLISSTVADPGFSCLNKESRKEEILDYKGYVECGSKCECSVFEIMCLIKDPTLTEDELKVAVNNGYQLLHKSVEFEKSKCKVPNCACNTIANWSPLSLVVLDKKVRLGEPAYIELPTY